MTLEQPITREEIERAAEDLGHDLDALTSLSMITWAEIFEGVLNDALDKGVLVRPEESR